MFVDFDGTIALDDTTDLILERFADPAWRAIEADWVAGLIGSRECLARQIDLVRASPEALDALADDAAYDPAFPSFVRYCQNHDIPVTVISDGLDRVAQTVLARAGVDVPVLANHLEWRGGDRWRLGFPYAVADCRSRAGHCKCVALTRTPYAMRMLIGDGRSDFCAAESADVVLAKGKLAEHCRTARLPYIPFADFAEAKSLLAEWIETSQRRQRAARPTEMPVHAPSPA
jgi:2-hydroxy-3-keto-5-methylthiopentenyl-1-phosphate phosphatase